MVYTLTISLKACVRLDPTVQHGAYERLGVVVHLLLAGGPVVHPVEGVHLALAAVADGKLQKGSRAGSARAGCGRSD